MVGKAHYGYQRGRGDPLTNDYFKMLLAQGRQDDHDVTLSQRAGNNVPFRSKLPKELSLERWTGDSRLNF